MRILLHTVFVLFATFSATFAAPPDEASPKDAPRPKPPAADRPVAKDKTDAAGALAERRAAAARQKAADAAKRLFPRFDANRDGALDETEWTKAQAAVDKMVDAEVLKTAGARRELVREALKNMTRPEAQRNGTDVSPEAVEQYARDLLAAATDVAENAQPEIAPVPPPQAGRRGNSDNGEEPRNGRFGRRPPRADATDEERKREEELRRRGLEERNGKIVPIVPGRPGAKPPANGDNPNKPQRPTRPGGARP